MTLPNVVVVLSEKERRRFVATLGKDKKVVVIRNAVNIGQYGRQAAKQYQGTQRRIIYVGRLHRDKGVLDLLEAVSLLKSRGRTDVSVVIAGSGPHEDLIRSRILELGVQSEVQMIGAVRGAQKMAVWKDADIFVLPSYHEGLPYAVLESLASGTPLITTRVGAIPEILEEGVHALFVDPGQPVMLGKAIERLASDGDAFHRMSGECLKRAQEEFGIERLAHDIDIVYKGSCGST